MVKNPPAMQEVQETRVGSLGQEDPLEKEIATHCNILAWRRIPWRSLTGSVGLQRVGHEHTHSLLKASREKTSAARKQDSD